MALKKRFKMTKSSVLPFSILFCAGAAMITIMVYSVMQNQWQGEALLQNITELQNKLKILGEKKPSGNLCEKAILCNTMREAIGRKINCDQYWATLQIMKKLHKDGDIGHPIEKWNSIPRPFIQLSGNHTMNSAGSDENSRILYWNIDGSTECNQIDPTLVKKSMIRITEKGNYYVHSRIHFKCPDGISGPHIHRHSINMIEDSDEAPYPLLENSYQLCDGPNRDQDSYQGGMYYLYPGSLLYVETDELAGDRTLSDGIQRNPEFGLYML